MLFKLAGPGHTPQNLISPPPAVYPFSTLLTAFLSQAGLRETQSKERKFWKTAEV